MPRLDVRRGAVPRVDIRAAENLISNRREFPCGRNASFDSQHRNGGLVSRRSASAAVAAASCANPRCFDSVTARRVTIPHVVVTNLSQARRGVYQKVYCAGGDIENRIKEQRLHRVLVAENPIASDAGHRLVDPLAHSGALSRESPVRGVAELPGLPTPISHNTCIISMLPWSTQDIPIVSPTVSSRASLDHYGRSRTPGRTLTGHLSSTNAPTSGGDCRPQGWPSSFVTCR